MNTSLYLHERFNPRSDQIPPVRLKGFKRGHLAKLFRELGFERGAEVGVAEGHFSGVICDANPGVRHYCVDLWDAYYRGRKKLKDRAMQDEAYADAEAHLAQFDTVLIRQASMKAVNDFADNSLDYVYIDGDHSFDFVMSDLIWWGRKVRSGGIISGHDYYRFRGAGVVDAVDAYTKAQQVREWFVCDEREVSFFWAKR